MLHVLVERHFFILKITHPYKNNNTLHKSQALLPLIYFSLIEDISLRSFTLILHQVSYMFRHFFRED